MTRYRILNQNTVIKAGDVVADVNGDWVNYKRLTKYEPKYRLLKAGEVIKDGDEFRYCKDLWLKTGPMRKNEKVQSIDVGGFRRRLHVKTKVD